MMRVGGTVRDGAHGRPGERSAAAPGAVGWPAVGRVLLRPGGAVLVAALLLLAAAPGEDQHQLLVVAAELAFLAAGATHLLRGRLTGNSTNRQIGFALVGLGMHLPAGFAVRVLLDEDGVVLAQGVEAAVVAAAAVLALRGLLPTAPHRLRQGLVGGVVTVAIVLLGLLASHHPTLVRGALAAGYLGTALLWAAVAVVADRVDPLGNSGRASSQAIALVAVAVAVGAACTGVAALVDPGHLVQVLTDALMLGAGLMAAAAALRRIADALDGQERYVAALVEQLAHHELLLQQTRGCLHDARSTLAGIQAATSATHHPSARSDPGRRQQLERAAADEMHRLQRMLRMPDRTPHVAEVDLGELMDSLVAVHRERGLRVRQLGVGTEVHADGDAVAVIVGNLLGNALVHAPGALVTVDVRVDTALTITVEDDGTGLTDLQRLGVFEAGARRDGSPGEGIGLSMSRDLARRHGGDLVARQCTSGALFRLTLPLHPAVEPVPAAAVDEVRTRATGLRLAG